MQMLKNSTLIQLLNLNFLNMFSLFHSACVVVIITYYSLCILGRGDNVTLLFKIKCF